MNTFSIKEALSFGWRSTRENLGYWVKAYGIVVLTMIIAGIVGQYYEEGSYSRDFVDLIFNLFIILLTMGVITMSLGIYDKKRPPLSALFLSGSNFLRFLGTNLAVVFLTVVVSLLGIIPMVIWPDMKFAFLILFVPAVYIFLRLSLSWYIIVDKKISIVDSMKRSWAITRGNVVRLMLLDLILLGILLLGIIVLIVGLIIAFPVVRLSITYAYRQMDGSEGPSIPGMAPASGPIIFSSEQR